MEKRKTAKTSMAGTMKTLKQNQDGLPVGQPPLTDGLYLVDRDRHVLVQQGILYFPDSLVPATRQADRLKRALVVMSRMGKTMAFVRAADLVSVFPFMGAKVKNVATRLGCKL